MRKNVMRSLICLVLAIVLFSITPIQTMASSNVYYVSDIIISTGSSLAAAKKKLPAGYVAVGGDVNEHNDGAVVIGVKRTTDKSKAITDLAVMNMKGGYSFEDYNNVLKEYQDKANEIVDNIYCAVLEFRNNYKAKTIPALMAYELLNRFTDEDFTEGSNKIGDIFINESTTKEQMAVIFMQASTAALSAIESCLGLGVASNWVDSFLNMPSDTTYDVKDDEDAQVIFGTLARFQSEMKGYEDIFKDSQLTKESTEEEWKAYYESLTKEQKEIVDNYANTYDYLKITKYKNGTLLDFFMQDLKTMENSSLYPMARAMSEGQIATLPYSSFCNAFQYAVSNEKTLTAMLEQIRGEKNAKTVSVFDGVDRSIFTADGIALTNEALRNATSSSDTSWYAGNLSKETEAIFYGIMGTVAGIAAISIGVSIYAAFQVEAIVSAAYASAFANLSFVETGIILEQGMASVMGGEAFAVTEEVMTISQAGLSSARAAATQVGANSVWSTVAAAAKIISAVAIAVVLITIVIYLIKEYRAYNEKKKEYTVIPRIIVDQTFRSDNTRKYTYYYAVKDTTGEYADMNNWDGTEWNALYYTKDSSVGSPIIADAITIGTKTSSDSDYNFAVHAFGEKAAYNLNNYADTKTGLFMFFKSVSGNYTGTAVSFGGYAIAVASGLLAGALGMFAALKMINKRKKQAQEG